MRNALLSCVLLLWPMATAFAQTAAPDPATWVAGLAPQFSASVNVTYLEVDKQEVELDVFAPRSASATAPVPTVLYFHGGGWTGGDKIVASLWTLPYLELGWAVVNVNYRLGEAPAAVEDCRCALRWVIRNAARYGFDVNRLVVTGDSAGSHLALTTGMLPASAGLDTKCPGTEELKVAAIVNWFGVNDVVDVLEGEHQQRYAVRWLGGLPNAKEVAQRVSPIRYVRAGLPPTITIHGDADTIAPYGQSVRMHKALTAAEVPNRLVTVPGGGHGGFSREQLVMSFAAVREFLQKHGIARRN